MEPAQAHDEGELLKQEIAAAIEAEISSIMASKLSRREIAVQLAIARVTIKGSQETIEDYQALADELITSLAYAAAKKIDMRTDVVRLAFDTGRLAAKAKASKRARDAANALHDKPGSSREKRAAIRAIWATGKYKSRDLCAEQECAALDMAFGTARRALRGTPDPG